MIPQAYNLFENQEWNKTLWPLCTEENEYYCMMDLMHTNMNRWNEVQEVKKYCPPSFPSDQFTSLRQFS